ncbi:MAG: hypothetical protein KF852_04110 [Saprospiraceae bacterium]|nr:hypothetical protein [Saprospiraceae bacterium]
MKNVTIRISDEITAAAEKLYSAKVTGLQIATEVYFELQRRTMQELKGRFSEKEIHAMADNQNGTELQTQFGCDAKMMWWQIEDGNTYDNLFAKWDLDGEALKKKILELTSAQTWFLQDAIRRFWRQNNTDLSILSTELL